MKRQAPEVLAPAGSPECLRAAIAGGADAVYLGLRHFNARGRATNFRLADLPGHVAEAHAHDVRCYVVLNTLLHDDEFPKALEFAERALAAEVDAFIVQDLGLWRELRTLFPEAELHASTQMSVHSAEQIAELAALGARRVILARELGRDALRACVATGRAHDVEVEHFVHGALCYAFSGQCLMSNFAGCRSANRGTCAQNCRFHYHEEDGGTDTTLSMRDFSLLAHVGELADMGIASLKIEGRLKGPDYVYTISQLYREACDAWARGEPYALEAGRERQGLVFSRGHTDAPLQGIYDARGRCHLDDQLRADARLIELDRRSGQLVLRSARAPQAGDGYRCRVEDWEDGFLILDAQPEGRPEHWRCRVRIEVHGPHLPAGTACERNRSDAIERDWRAALRQLSPAAPSGLRLDMQVSGAPGMPLEVTARCADGRQLALSSEAPLQAARGAALDAERVAQSLGALGGSGFRLGRLEVAVTGACFMPASALKRLRRTLVDQLTAQTVPARAAQWQGHAAVSIPRCATQLHVAVSDAEAAWAAHAAGAETIWYDDPRVDYWGERAPQLPSLPPNVWLRHPAIAPVSPHLAELGMDVIAGHIGVLRRARELGLRAMADHCCNVVNSHSAALLHELGSEAAVISLECSAREVARLAARHHGAGHPGQLLLCVHGRLPSMLTRQQHGLAAGQEQRIQARSREGGLPYRLEGRADGSTVVWEARQLCAPEHARLSAGVVDGWLLETGGMDTEAVAWLAQAYRRLANGEDCSAAIQAWSEARAADGCFAGHLAIGSRALDGG